MPVPQIDLRAAYLEHKARLDEALLDVLDSGWYILGRQVEGFEAEFSAFLGVPHAVAVANGTDALALALRACGVGAGDRVATVSHTAVASVAAIEMVGAQPVLVDIEPKRYTMDPESLRSVLAGARIRAVIAVHLYGQPVDLAAIGRLTADSGAILIEDCAQAHGAFLGSARLGSLGQAAAFSFYPTKNLGALGDGGLVATADPGIAERLRALRQYGWRERYVSDIAGVNSRLDELQAAALRLRLPLLDRDNARRRAVAGHYDQALSQPADRSGREVRAPWRPPGVDHVFHQYVVASSARDDLRAFLRERGVATNIHYPVPVHLQGAYRGRLELAPAGLPNTERAARQVLSLPMYPQLSPEQVETVCAALRAWQAQP